MEEKSSPRLALLNKYLQDSPEDPFLLFAIAKEYEKMENPDLAFKYYLQLRDSNPEYVGTYYHLGKLYEHTGEASSAFSTYKTGIQFAKKAGDQKSLEELAEAKMTLGDDEDFEE